VREEQGMREEEIFVWVSFFFFFFCHKQRVTLYLFFLISLNLKKHS
jgi:hypothetical protein